MAETCQIFIHNAGRYCCPLSCPLGQWRNWLHLEPHTSSRRPRRRKIRLVISNIEISFLISSYLTKFLSTYLQLRSLPKYTLVTGIAWRGSSTVKLEVTTCWSQELQAELGGVSGLVIQMICWKVTTEQSVQSSHPTCQTEATNYSTWQFRPPTSPVIDQLALRAIIGRGPGREEMSVIVFRSTQSYDQSLPTSNWTNLTSIPNSWTQKLRNTYKARS